MVDVARWSPTILEHASDIGPAVTPTPSSRTATFLFTDIEGSMRLWEEQRDAMVVTLEAHDALLPAAVEQAGGTVVKTTGDGTLGSPRSRAASSRKGPNAPT